MRRASALLLVAFFSCGFWRGTSPIPVIEPGVSWNGTVGSGTCPALDTSQQVSGLLAAPWSYRSIGNIDAPPDDAVEDGNYIITAGAATSNRTGIARVQICLEGTVVNVETEGVNPNTGSRGFNFKIQSRSGGSGVGMNGLANLIVDYYPRDGYVQRTTQRMWLNSNTASGTSYIDRTTRVKWVDPVNGVTPAGNCSANPTAGNTKATAVKNLYWASACVGDGGLVYIVSGATLIEDVSGCPGGVCGTHTRLTTVMPEPGGARWTLSRTNASDPGGQYHYRPSIFPLKWQDFNVNSKQIPQVYIGSGSFIAQRCDVSHPDGPIGGKYMQKAPGITLPFYPHNEDSFTSVLECTFSTPEAPFATLTRNTSGIASQDLFVVGFRTPTQSNLGTRSFNYTADEVMNFQFPNSSMVPMTVSAVGSFTSGRTLLTFSGSPNITATNSNFHFTVLSGALQGQIFTVFNSPASNQLSITGNLTSMVPGDLAWVWIDFHSDCFQFFQPIAQTYPNFRNIYMQNFNCSGVTVQPLLPQPTTMGTAGTFSTVGTAFAMSTLTVGSVGAFSGGQTVITWSGSPTLSATIPTAQRLYVGSGPLAGTDFAVVAQNNTTKTTTVTGDASTIGIGFTAQLGHNLVVDDYVQLGTAGVNTEGKHVGTILTPRTATLSAPFSTGDQTNQGWRRARSVTDVAWVGTVVDRYQYVNGSFGQLGSAARNWAFVQVTWPTSMLWFRNDSSMIADAVYFLDSIVNQIDWPFAGGVIPPGNLWGGDNNQIQYVTATCTAINIPTDFCGTNTVLGPATYDKYEAVNLGNLDNDGNGTITGISLGGGTPQTGGYLITMSDSNGTYYGVTNFTIRRPDGTFMPTGTVGVPYTSGEINFTINAGSTAFNYFDKFIVRVRSRYAPTGGLTKTAIGNLATGRPLYGWNFDGTPMPSIGTALIGAQQP